MIFRVISEIEFSHQLRSLMNVSGSDHKNKTANKKKEKTHRPRANKIIQQAHHTSDIYKMIH